MKMYCEACGKQTGFGYIINEVGYPCCYMKEKCMNKIEKRVTNDNIKWIKFLRSL